MGCLGNRLGLPIRRRNLDHPRHGLVQVGFPNPGKVQGWVVRQWRPIRLWIIWRHGYHLVRNRHRNIAMAVTTKGQFTWHFITNNCPPGWCFTWHLNRLIGVPSNRRGVNHVTVWVNIIDLCRVITGRVGHRHGLIICHCGHHHGWYRRLTSGVPRHGWDLVGVPLASRPVAVSYRTRHLIDIRRPGQLNSLFNRLRLAIRRRHFDGPRHGFVQVLVPHTLWISLRRIVWQLIG